MEKLLAPSVPVEGFSQSPVEPPSPVSEAQDEASLKPGYTKHKGRTPAAALEAHEAKQAERLAAIKTRPTKESILATRRASAEKARQVQRAKRQVRDAIREKVRLGMPITEDEEEKLRYRSNVAPDPAKQNAEMLATAARLVVRSGDVKTLRGLVEKVAEKHKYNPLEQLIMMTLPDAEGRYSLPADERAAIHKSLLPYLTPQLKVAPLKEPEPEAAGTKVTIRSFIFPEEKSAGKIYDAPRVRVSTTPGEPALSGE